MNTSTMLRLVPDLEPEDDLDGDAPLSFDANVLPLYNELVIFARKLCNKNTARADDIVQTSMMKAFQAWPNFVPRDGITVDHAVRGWLYTIAANTFTKAYHHAGVESRNESHPDIVSRAHGYDEECDLRKQVDSPIGDEVAAAIAALSPDHRDVIEGLYLCDMTCEEIAAVLGIKKNTVFTRLARAKVALEKALADYARVEYGLRGEASGRFAGDEGESWAEQEPEGLHGTWVTLAEATERPQPDTRGIDGIVAGHDRRAL